MAVLLTRRAVLQAAMETTYNTTATVGVNDGVLVMSPTYMAEPNVLEREFTRDTLSQQNHIVGRLTAKMEFETELRGNGRQNSGILSDAPIIARLFRACGYGLTASATKNFIGPFTIGAPANDVSWVANASTATNTDVIAYYITVTTAGASGVAMVTVTSDTAGQGSAAATITSGTIINLGTFTCRVTPTFTGTLALGTRWVVWFTPAGLTLKPVSDNFESVTLVMYKDSVKHVMPGSFGTFEITADSGEFAKIKWTFQGTYVAPTDSALPSPVYERTLPAQVELGRLRLDSFQAVVNAFTFNQQNDIQIRQDVSAVQGYIGTRIVGRKPEGGVDPEADNVASYDFWSALSSASRFPFQMRVGTQVGNTIWMIAPNVQYSGMTYQDRDGILTYDAGLKFAGYQADDEFLLFLM
jgi:hypothetical protein